eukprot:COSAG04_NODE_5099_length_1738_cov_1.904820_2_plen_38_part_01
MSEDGVWGAHICGVGNSETVGAGVNGEPERETQSSTLY